MWMMPLHLHVNQKSDYIYISVVYFGYMYLGQKKKSLVSSYVANIFRVGI